VDVGPLSETAREGTVMNDDDLKRIEGPAFSCIIATICALAMTQLSGNNQVVLALSDWLVFVVITGFFINPLYYSSLRQLFIYCMIPAGWLVFAWISHPVISVIWGEPLNKDFFYRLFALATIMFVSSCVGILIAVFARRPLIKVITTDEGEIARINHSLRAWGLLATVVYGAFIWIKHNVFHGS
jgi:hypothetical protein